MISYSEAVSAGIVGGVAHPATTKRINRYAIILKATA